jgi:hypothetical protein
MSRLLDRAQAVSAAQVRWRFALVEIAADTLQTVHPPNTLPPGALLKEEARQRAGRFLRLALVDDVKPALPQKQLRNNIWNHRAVARLGRFYRELPAATGRADSTQMIRDVLLGYAAACRPIVPDFNVRLAMRTVPLDRLQKRVLALLVGCIVGGVVEQAAERGGGGRVALAIHPLGDAAANLTFQTREPIGLPVESAGYEIAARLAAALQGELVCKKTLWEGSTLELRFATKSARLESRQGQDQQTPDRRRRSSDRPAARAARSAGSQPFPALRPVKPA